MSKETLSHSKESLGPRKSLIEIREYATANGFLGLHRVFAGLDRERRREHTGRFMQVQGIQQQPSVFERMSPIFSRLDQEGPVDKEALFQDIFDHSVAVAWIALQIAGEYVDKGGEIDYGDVVNAALLHDIGAGIVTIEGQKYINHGTEGREILKLFGLPVELPRVAAHHTGFGLSHAVIDQFDLPLEADEEVLMPDSPLEKIVCLADKMHSKQFPPGAGPQVARAVSLDAAVKLASLRFDRDENLALYEELASSVQIEPEQFGETFARDLAKDVGHYVSYVGKHGDQDDVVVVDDPNGAPFKYYDPVEKRWKDV